MIYDYKCTCGEEFAVVKSIMEYAGNQEPCPKCYMLASRFFRPPQRAIIRDFEPAYYHSLGKVIHNRKELQYNLDKNNLVAVGNDFSSGESMQKHFEADREYRDKKRWENFEI